MRLSLILTLSLIGGTYADASAAAGESGTAPELSVPRTSGAPVIPRGGWAYPRQLTPASAWGAPPPPVAPAPPAYLTTPAPASSAADTAVPYEQRPVDTEAAEPVARTSDATRPVYRPVPRPVERPYVYTPVMPASAATAPRQDVTVAPEQAAEPFRVSQPEVRPVPLAEPATAADSSAPYTSIAPEPALEAPAEPEQALAPSPLAQATSMSVPAEATADPYAPRRDALIFQLDTGTSTAAPPQPVAPATPVHAQDQATGAPPADYDPYAPRRDAPIFRLQNPVPSPQTTTDGTAPAQPSADTSQPAPTAGGVRYYSVHRQAGRQPDPPQRPAPVYLDALPVDLATPVSSEDLAAPPEAPQLIRDANGRVRTVADPDDLY